jgi:NADPH:quinone reductase-like Zn-dependent oxidoreductase
MLAAVREDYGEPEAVALRESTGQRWGREVLVEVRVAGIDPGVWHLVTGLPYLLRLMGFGLWKPKTPLLGGDVAGPVEAVGRSSRSLWHRACPSRATLPRRRTTGITGAGELRFGVWADLGRADHRNRHDHKRRLQRGERSPCSRSRPGRDGLGDA